ncbi:MAG TPA: hypothetical protein VH600_20275 [Burkholderiales bacterium]
MKRAPALLKFCASGSLVATLVGCANPQTADEFRKSYNGPAATVGLDRPLRDVAATFQSRAPECLSVTVRRSIPGPTYQVADTAYAPKVVVSTKRVELSVQMRYVRGVLTSVGEPEGGYYTLVADVYPVDVKRSRLEMFGSDNDHVLGRAITGWATGKNLGCPDMTKG